MTTKVGMKIAGKFGIVTVQEGIMKFYHAFAAAAAAATLAASPAASVELITYAQFFQNSSAKIFEYDAQADRSVMTVSGGMTTLIGLAFLQSDPVGTLYGPTTFTMSATSFSPVVETGIQFEQEGFAGTMSFFEGTTEVLTLHFSNAIFNYAFGNPASASLIVDCFCGITWSSDVFVLPAGIKDFSLGINAVNGSPWNAALASAGNYYGEDFRANVVGTFAAVPEPQTWAMLIAGFGLVGFAARRRRSDIATVGA